MSRQSFGIQRETQRTSGSSGDDYELNGSHQNFARSPPSYREVMLRGLMETEIDVTEALLQKQEGLEHSGSDELERCLEVDMINSNSLESLPFADESLSDCGMRELSANAAPNTAQDSIQQRIIGAAEERRRTKFEAMREENSMPGKPKENELLIASDCQVMDNEESDIELRFRGASTWNPTNNSSNQWHRDGGRSSNVDDVGLECVELSFIDTDRVDQQESTYPDTNDGRDNASVESRGGVEPEPKIPDCPHPALTYVLIKWYGLSDTKKLIAAGILVFLVGVILLVTLLPASFVYVEYYEYALHRNKWTNKIDYSTVYGSGCYLMAPQDEMVRLKSTAHHVQMTLAVMNKESLSIQLQLMLQYFLKREEVVELFRRYHLGYDRVIKNIIEGTVKDTAISFTMDDYRLHRKMVEAALLHTLKLALSGNCCPNCCPMNCRGNQTLKCADCDPSPNTCTRGKHVEVRYFQMGAVTIPEDVSNRYMHLAVLQIEAEREFHIQDKAVVEKNTSLAIQQIHNEAREIKERATAEAFLSSVKATASRDCLVQRNKQAALKHLFADLNVTEEKNQLSFIYLNSLMKIKHNLLAFNYATQTALTP